MLQRLDLKIKIKTQLLKTTSKGLLLLGPHNTQCNNTRLCDSAKAALKRIAHGPSPVNLEKAIPNAELLRKIKSIKNTKITSASASNAHNKAPLVEPPIIGGASNISSLKMEKTCPI